MNAEDPDTGTDPANPNPSVAPGAPPAAPEAEKDSDVGLEDAVNAATKAARADAVAIAELCQLAGQPQRTAAFLAEGASEGQVRRSLLASRADSPEISSVIHPDAAAKAASADQNPLITAVKKLTGKD